MLQLIRSTVGSWVVKILFVLLIASFGVWGIGDVLRGGGPSNTVAEIGPRSVTVNELDQEFRNQMDRLRPLFGGALTAEQARQFGLLDQAMASIVQRTLFDLAADDAGLLVSDDLIRQRIAQEPAFRNTAGQFDPNVFNAVLRNNGLTEAGYVAMLRGDIARSLIANPVAAGAAAPQALVEALHRRRGEKRVAEVITISNASITDVSAPEDTVVQKYYEDHAVRFTAPEYRRLTVGVLSVDDLARDITVSDADLRARYDERAGEFNTPETRTLRMVVVDDEAKAKAIANAAATGGLDDAAKAAGVEPVTLDGVTRDELPEIGGTAFALAVGAVGEPVRSTLGWHVIGVTAVTPGASRGFDEVRDTIAKDLKHERAFDQIYDISSRIDDRIAAGTPLEEVAQAQGMRLVSVPAVDATGQTPEGTSAEGLPDPQQALQSAFSLEPGQTSTVLEATDSRFFVVRVDTVTPPRRKPLEEVRAEAIAGWEADQRAERAAAKAKEIAAALGGGAEADAQRLAEEAGGSFAMTAPFTRAGRAVEGLTPEVITRLFDAKPGDVVTGVNGDAQVIARLKEVIPADPKAVDSQLSTSVRQGIESDLIGQFTQALRDRYTVEVKQDRIAQMYATP